MTSFIIHFLLCNFLISGMIGVLFLVKKQFKKYLTSRTQYNLWYLLLGVMTVPFFPVSSNFSLFSWIPDFQNVTSPDNPASNTISALNTPVTAVNWMNDFSVSVSSQTPSVIRMILFSIWIIGMLAMILLVLKSSFRLHRIKKSALPLQNRNVQNLYHKCCKELNIVKDIPIYSTAFLTSPVMTGSIKPCIYLPIHLISDYKPETMRYMLLHELQHYRHKDNIANYLMNLAGIVYWFNPLIWLALRSMRNDREIACDIAVLNVLDSDQYQEYGYTLINFAEKISLTPFPFSSGLGGTVTQIQARILNIAAYQTPSVINKVRSVILFSIIAVFFLGITPVLTSYTAANERYAWDTSDKRIVDLDVADYFQQYDGSFVLYDLNHAEWNIYNMDTAAIRISPYSTYKIYDALFALEENIITPEHSLLAWNHENYSFEAWNQDQTLSSAMRSSVNWYFQNLDHQLGRKTLRSYFQKIGYGNETVNGDLSSYWMESSLKISPLEQVELLISFYQNEFDFAPENIQAVKDSLQLSSSAAGTLYGKTGTGRIDGQDTSGWFIGFIETTENTYFFASNIQAERNATGSMAAEISLSILSDKNIW